VLVSTGDLDVTASTDCEGSPALLHAGPDVRDCVFYVRFNASDGGDGSADTDRWRRHRLPAIAIEIDRYLGRGYHYNTLH